jgi:hypothetical protein
MIFSTTVIAIAASGQPTATVYLNLSIALNRIWSPFGPSFTKSAFSLVFKSD